MVSYSAPNKPPNCFFLSDVQSHSCEYDSIWYYDSSDPTVKNGVYHNSGDIITSSLPYVAVILKLAASKFLLATVNTLSRIVPPRFGSWCVYIYETKT